MMILTGSCSGTRRLVSCVGIILVIVGLPGSTAQDETTCSDLTVSGLEEGDGFPSESTIYTNTVGDEDIKGKYVSEDETYFIWYSPSEPEDYSSGMSDASDGDCTGTWVISSYPVGAEFTDDVWYQADTEGVRCESSPADIDSSDWQRAERNETTVTVTEAVVVLVECADDGDGGGISNRDVILILIVVGVGFMACLCCGALICCIRGKNTNEEAVMPPGELGEGSIIGAKAEQLKPGLHAHPEVAGQQHPRPEDWAPSHASSGSIPLGSRSGPSVRSIGYT